MASKWIKNVDTVDHTYLGQLVTPSTYYKLQSHEEISWANDTTLLIAIVNGEAIVAKDDSGNNDIININDGINYLKDNFAPEVKALIVEETTPTGGHFQARGEKIDLAANETKTQILTWPFPVSILSATWVYDLKNKGDEIEVSVAPHTTIGTITSDVAASATVIDVSQTVIDNIALGFWFTLTDGTNTDECGRVINVDEENLQVTVETATTNSFTAATPTYVQQTVKMISKLYLQGEGSITVGNSKVGASHLPANKPLSVTYINNDAQVKDFIFLVEYLY